MVKASQNTNDKAVLIYQNSQEKIKEIKKQFELSKQLESSSDNLYIEKKNNSALILQEMKNLSAVKLRS